MLLFEELSSILKVDDEEHVLLDLEKELILQHLVALESDPFDVFLTLMTMSLV